MCGRLSLIPRTRRWKLKALEAFRERRLTGFQLRTLLGIQSRYELDGFLKKHRIEKYTIEDFDDDLAIPESQQNSDRKA